LSMKSVWSILSTLTLKKSNHDNQENLGSSGKCVISSRNF
jgi:hypothetical protein